MPRPHAFAMTTVAAMTLLSACGDGRTGQLSHDALDERTTQSPHDTLDAHDSQVAVNDTVSHEVAIDTLARPAMRSDTMFLEGDPHRFEARRLDASLYSLYYPVNDMIVEQGASDEGEGVRLIANFGGIRTDSAFLHIFTPNDPASGPAEMRRLLLEPSGIINSRGWRAEENTKARYPWALESYAITGTRGSTIVGSAAIGRHRGRGILVVTAYPAEFADGMGPRTASILESLEWRDTRTGLAREDTTTRPRRRDSERNQRLHL